MNEKLAIITTHPVQYYAPLFRQLAKSIDLKVFYTWDIHSEEKFDPGFGKKIQWDVPLLEGYSYHFVKNNAKKKGSHSFWGIQNPTLNQEIIDWKATQLLVFGWSYYSHIAAMVYFKGKIPVFFRGDSTLLDRESVLKTSIRKIILSFVYRFVDKAFFVGNANKDYFKNFGLKADQLFFAPHSIDNDRFSRKIDPTLIQQKRNEQGIKQNELVILFAGKFESKKNPLLLVQSFIALDLKGVKLLLVGNGILEGQLKHAAKDHQNIKFIDFQNQSEMPLIYQLADLFCLPSQGRGETWGLAVNEAMAAGKPCLVSDKCGCWQDLIRPWTGLVFNSNNQQDLSNKLQLMINQIRNNSSYFDTQKTIVEYSISKTAENMIKQFKHDL